MMDINWFYFSDTNEPPGEIKTLLEKKQFQLTATNQIAKLNYLLTQSKQSVLFIKSHTLYNVYELCQEISALYPHVYIILIVPDNMENLKKAMLMGASDILRSSFKPEEGSEAIDHARKFMEHRAGSDHNLINLAKENCKVISVASPKGGAGRTLLTVNLAAALVRIGKRVAVIDANLQFGEVAVYSNLKPKRTIYEWIKEGYGRQDNRLEQYMHVNEAGVAVLAAPPRPEFFEGITELHLKEAIETAKKFFDVVLIDLPVYISEIHLRCLSLADEILLLTMNELSVLRNSKLYLEMLESIKLKDKVNLILNRQIKGQGLEINKLEEILNIKVYSSLPEQTSVAAASLKIGEPIIFSNSRSQLGKSICSLAEKLIEPTIDEKLVIKKEKRWFLIGK